jgi:hypothetical protein
VLYFDKATRKLQAWDDITVAGLGGTGAQIQRHLATDTTVIGAPVPDISLSPSPSPSSPSGSSPAASSTPSPSGS